MIYVYMYTVAQKSDLEGIKKFNYESDLIKLPKYAVMVFSFLFRKFCSTSTFPPGPARDAIYGEKEKNIWIKASYLELSVLTEAR